MTAPAQTYSQACPAVPMYPLLPLYQCGFLFSLAAYLLHYGETL